MYLFVSYYIFKFHHQNFEDSFNTRQAVALNSFLEAANLVCFKKKQIKFAASKEKY